jgi:hypothetical protein
MFLLSHYPDYISENPQDPNMNFHYLEKLQSHIVTAIHCELSQNIV